MNICTGQRLGNYHLLQLVGRGGFANVYLGRHIYLSTQAALKVLTAPLNEQEATEFLREARTLAGLIHPHIVRVLEFGIQDVNPFLVLDYASGGTLRRRHPRGEQLPLATIVNYVTQTASALQYAHSRHLIHRDVKPENILLGRDGEVLLADFGIAVLTQSMRSAQTQTIVGTPTYMAPEQLQGHPCQASDQYALGVLAYEWLCGTPPFSGSPPEIAAQHCLVPPPPLKDKVPSLAPQLERIILQALAKDPASRFPSVTAFADALSATLTASAPAASAPRIADAARGLSPTLPLPSQPVLSQAKTTRQGATVMSRADSDNRHGTHNPFASIAPGKQQEGPSSSLFSRSLATRPTTSHNTLWALVCGGGVGYFSSGTLLVLYKQASQGFTNEMAFLLGGGAVLLSLCCLLLTVWLARNLTGRRATRWIAGSSAGLTQQIAAGILSHIALGVALPSSFPLLLLVWGTLGGVFGLLGATRSSESMTTCSSTVAASMPPASPDNRSWLAIPAFTRLPKPVFEDSDIIDVVSLERSPDDDSLHGFGHIQPVSSTRGV